MKPVQGLTDDQRFPLLKDRRLLEKLRQDEAGPIFNFGSGDRLDAAALKRVTDYSHTLAAKEFWHENEQPFWLPDYLGWCKTTVEAYRGGSLVLSENPALRREQIAARPWQFVSSDARIEEMLVYCTSGTTGAPMDVLVDPVSQAAWIPQLESILLQKNIRIERGPDKVAICLVCHQTETLTYASLSTWLDGAGILKINLNPKDWKKPQDRLTYLEKYNPEIITGDPFTFMALAQLNPAIRPKAMVSSAMTLNEGLRQMLQKQFDCPVYDLYSLTECRMIAVSEKPGIYQLIRPELYVEILHPDSDEPVSAGARGEITVTGGINPFLPLIRYRTGDFASLQFIAGQPCLIDLEGRSPTLFLSRNHDFINHVDISRALSNYSLAGFTLHQKKDLSLDLSVRGTGVSEEKLRDTLSELFGKDIKMRINISKELLSETRKVKYSSEINETDLQPCQQSN